MNYLLDTHTFLWFLEGSPNLSISAKSAIEDSQSFNFKSIASIWEIAIKIKLGKLKLGVNLEELKSEILKNGFEILPLDFEHLLELSRLQEIHKDLFDRILISQAISEKFTLISKDTNFRLYANLKLVW